MPDFFRRLHCRVMAFASGEAGQGVPEYALLIALIALVTIAALTFLGGRVTTVYTVAGRAA